MKVSRQLGPARASGSIGRPQADEEASKAATFRKFTREASCSRTKGHVMDVKVPVTELIYYHLRIAETMELVSGMARR